MVVVDNIGNARKASRELRDQYGTGDDGWSDVTTLGQVLAVGAGRPADADITLFKPMGMGLSDLSVAILVYQRAVELGLGMALPARNVPMPRWTLA